MVSIIVQFELASACSFCVFNVNSSGLVQSRFCSGSERLSLLDVVQSGCIVLMSTRKIERRCRLTLVGIPILQEGFVGSFFLATRKQIFRLF